MIRLFPPRPRVFLSYRRSASLHLTTRIREGLERRGLDVFQDFDDLQKGQFGMQILAAIETRGFLPVLAPGTLDRCRVDSRPDLDFNPEDWILKEISHAHRHQRDTIPLIVGDFKWKDIDVFLPPDVGAWVKSLESVKIDQEALFEASLDRLLAKLVPNRWDRWANRPAGRRLIRGAILLVAVVLLVALAYAVYRCYYPLPVVFAAPEPVDNHIGWQDHRIQDIAPFGDDVWLATDQGLWVFRSKDGRFEPIDSVPDSIRLVTVDAARHVVWFTYAFDDFGPQPQVLGYYDWLHNDMGTVPIEIDGMPVSDPIHVVVLDASGQYILLGTSELGILTYDPQAQQWSQTLVQTADTGTGMSLPVNVIQSFIDEEQIHTWIINLSSLYRGPNVGESDWKLVNNSTLPNSDFGTARDIAADAFGNLWIAHENGISMLAEQEESWNANTVSLVDCVPPMVPGAAPTMSLATSHHGQFVWFVLEEGFYGVKAVQGVSECSRLQWYGWSAEASTDPFWSFPNEGQNELRIAADPEGNGGVWLFQLNTPQVRVADVSLLGLGRGE